MIDGNSTYCYYRTTRQKRATERIMQGNHLDPSSLNIKTRKGQESRQKARETGASVHVREGGRDEGGISRMKRNFRMYSEHL